VNCFDLPSLLALIIYYVVVGVLFCGEGSILHELLHVMLDIHPLNANIYRKLSEYCIFAAGTVYF